MRNIRLVISYDGTDFYGWQRQPNAPTVQACLEEAIERVTGQRVQVCGSGRTDAGVHALNQVANFRSTCRIPCANLVKALNDALPPAVRIKEAEQVAEGFHARYDAGAKTYRYRILQKPVCSPFISRFVLHYPFVLDRVRMAEAARLLEGEHDFTSFAGGERRPDEVGGGLEGSCEEKASQKGAIQPLREDATRMVRTLYQSRILWRPRTSLLVYEVKGNGFLPHMVRNIVGTLIDVGRGKITPQDMLGILNARDRTRAGATAQASGLCLVSVEY